MKYFVAVVILAVGVGLLWETGFFSRSARRAQVEAEKEQRQAALISAERANGDLRVEIAQLKAKAALLEEAIRAALVRENGLKAQVAQLERDRGGFSARVAAQEQIITQLKAIPSKEVVVQQKIVEAHKKIDVSLVKERYQGLLKKIENWKKEVEDQKKRLKVYEANLSYARRTANKQEEADLLDRMSRVQGDLTRLDGEISMAEEQALEVKGEILKADPDILAVKPVPEPRKPEMWYVNERGERVRIEAKK